MKKNNFIRFVDVESYLQDNNINYITSGKNVSQGWIGMSCPFCVDGDPSNHMGISLDAKTISCWRCGKTGNLISLVMKLHKCRFEESLKILKKYVDYSITDLVEIPIHNVNFTMPKNFNQYLPDNPKNYLKKRGYDPEYIWEKYNLFYPYPEHWGRYKHRIVIPFILNGEIVTYTTRDITGKMENKYDACPNKESMIPIGDCIYNIDNIKKNGNMVVFEGPTDVWKYEDNACALYGIKYTHARIRLIREKNPKNIFLIFDPGAEKQVEDLANELSIFFPVTVLFLSGKKDVGDMNKKEIQEIKDYIKGVYNG